MQEQEDISSMKPSLHQENSLRKNLKIAIIERTENQSLNNRRISSRYDHVTC